MSISNAFAFVAMSCYIEREKLKCHMVYVSAIINLISKIKVTNLDATVIQLCLIQF